MKLLVGLTYDLKIDYYEENNLNSDIYEEFDVEETIAEISNVLEGAGHTVLRLGSGKKFLERIQRVSVDIVFNIAEGFGTRSREAHVPAVLEILGIPYTGSDPLTLALTLDKETAKRVVMTTSVPTPPFKVIREMQDLKELNLDYPLIPKLLYQGSSIGLRKTSKVNNFEELEERVAWLLLTYQEPVIVEEFIEGREFTVGVLGNNQNAYVLGIMEISPKKGKRQDFIYSLESKRNWKELNYTVNPSLEKSLEERIRQVALTVHRVLGCRDVSRIDFRVDSEKKPYFLEVNPLPGLNPNFSDLPLIASGVGMEYKDLVYCIFENALQRYGMILHESKSRYNLQ